MSDDGLRADERFGTIPKMVAMQAARFADDLAVVDGDVRQSFADVASDMVLAGRAMVASGVGPGDTVAVLAPNCARWITAALGVMAAGARVLPVNTRFKGAE